LYIARDNRARFNSPLGGIYNAVSGNAMLVEDGKVLKGLDDSVQPRTAIALDERRRQLIIVLVDGRQPNYSEGITLDELAKLIVEFGGYTAMNLDGGGSTTLVIEDSNGKAKVLNSPIDQYIPGRERTIGSHLGIYASRE
jgi:exopolysaccharide biosynthesis protein